MHCLKYLVVEYNHENQSRKIISTTHYWNIKFYLTLFGCANTITVAFVFKYSTRQRIVEAVVMAQKKILVKSFDCNENTVPLLLHKLDNPQSANIRCNNQLMSIYMYLLRMEDIQTTLFINFRDSQYIQTSSN